MNKRFQLSRSVSVLSCNCQRHERQPVDIRSFDTRERERFQQHVQEQKGSITLTLFGPPRDVDTNNNTNQNKRVWRSASDAILPGHRSTPVGPGKDTHGTLGPLRREAVGGPTTSHNATRHNKNTDKSRVNGVWRNMCSPFVTLKSYMVAELFVGTAGS